VLHLSPCDYFDSKYEGKSNSNREHVCAGDDVKLNVCRAAAFDILRAQINLNYKDPVRTAQ
jgi:hypothetical protein